MGIYLQVLTPPSQEPVPLEDLKNWLRVDQDFADDDDLIQDLAVSARQLIEQAFDVSLCTQTIQLSLDRFPIPGNPYLWQQYSFGYWYDRIPMMSLAGSWWPDRAAIFVPRPPLISVAALNYYDMTGTFQTLDPSQYLVDTQRMPGRITPIVGGFWPFTQTRVDAVQIQYLAGYGGPGSVPSTIKTAIKTAVYSWYECRGDAGQLPDASLRLLYSIWGGEYY